MSSEGKLRLAVFDWAGTTVDYGSSAPMRVFEQVFQEAGIHLTREEINGPMGMEKKAHIRMLLSLESASEQWKERCGRSWNEEDVETLYKTFEGKLSEVVAKYSTPIDGVIETVSKLRNMGLKIGSTTGYTSEMMKAVIPQAAALGYSPDCVVTPDVTGIGRPSPFMIFECMRRLSVYPPFAVIKVGDTVTDILEGKNAGAWSVGILEGSNLLGLTEEEYEAADAGKLEALKKAATEKYLEAGADLVLDSIRDLPEAVLRIEEHLRGGKELEPLL